MVKTVYNFLAPILEHEDVKNVPKPPPLPRYEAGCEPALWSFRRMNQGITPLEEAKTWPKVGDTPKDDDKPDWRGVVKNKVIALPLPGKYDYGQPQDQRYFWFDTPDYADPFKKLWWSAKFFFKTGGVAWCTLGIALGKGFTWKDNIWLIERTLKPWFVGGMVGSLFVITIANLRGNKDDYWNYSIAGTIAGCYIGRRDHYSWFRCMLLWPPLAVFAKHNAETNGLMAPSPAGAIRSGNISLSGQSAEHGFWSGDLRFGFRSTEGENGRDQRQIAH